MKTLNVIEAAYRGTIEEQDDTIVWLTHAMKSVGAELGVLLRGSAVNHAVKEQDASGLAFGDVAQTQPPRLAEDLSALVQKGVPVWVVAEDLADRGVRETELIEGVECIGRSDLPELFGSFQRVWHW